MIRFYDTNVLLNSPLDKLFDEKFYISSVTIHELEHIKTSATKSEEIKYKARTVCRALEDNKDKYEVILFKPKYLRLMKRLNLEDIPDNRIIISAYVLQKKQRWKHLFNPELREKVIFCTHDVICKLCAAALHLEIFDFDMKDEDDYTGFLDIYMDDDDLIKLYSTTIPHNINEYELIEGQYLLIHGIRGEVIDKYVWKDGKYTVVPFGRAESKMFGKVSAKNQDAYQEIALDSLARNQITMLRGSAGTGKSYLAFAYMFSLLEKGKIDKIIMFCNTVATKGSAKLGFYPGSRTEKLLDSQIGNLLESKLGDRSEVERLIDEGQLVLLPMSDIRGYDTTGMRAAIYITEAQNLDIELMRLALTRIGDDSICILDGDSAAQVDMDMYAGANNGMRRVSKVFRGADCYGEVTLVNVWRSKIARLAQRL